MLRKQSRSLTNNTYLAAQSPSLSRCGLLRTRKNRKESAVMTDRLSSSSMHFSDRWVAISPSIKVTKIVSRLRAGSRIISPVMVDIKVAIKIKEVEIAAEEVASVVVDTETRTIRALLEPDLKCLFSPLPR